MEQRVNILTLKRLGIDTQKEFIIYMRRDCEVCQSEGFEALTRIEVYYNSKMIIATLNIIDSDLLEMHQVSLSESAWKELQASEGKDITLRHPSPIESFEFIKQKILGQKLDQEKYDIIIRDVVRRKYSSTQLAAFITACASASMTTEEVIGLTKAMVDNGEHLKWDYPIVADKHCIGGLPGNRTTPIVVAICAEAGLRLPKTSSRAITSAAGTADTMEVMTDVHLSMDRIRQLVHEEHACLAWGGAINISPADDILIRVERTIDLDSEGQMIASILSKKVAAGSSHILIDIPVGEDQKVRSHEDAEMLAARFELVGKAMELEIKVAITDGRQPIGWGIGPQLEAVDVVSVLKNEDSSPRDLREKSLSLAADLIHLAMPGVKGLVDASLMAEEILVSGRAYERFVRICRSQGRYDEPSIRSKFHRTIFAERSGEIQGIRSALLGRTAKLAGAPSDAGAGVRLHRKLAETTAEGDPLFTVFAASAGELEYALDFVKGHRDIYHIVS